SFMVVFLGLPLVIYLVFVISPFVQAMYYSLTNWSGFSDKMPFVGFDNYVKLFHDDIFMLSVRNSIILAIFLPIITVILSLVLATLVTIGGSSRGQIKGLKGSGFYRIVSFFPYVIPAVVIGIIWAQIYDPSSGLLNGILTGLGFDGLKSYPWLGDPRTAMIASMVVIVWGFVGFYMILFIAAIKGIPAETFEAARIDGAGRFRTATTITIPLIRDNIQTAYVYMGILALDAFVYMSVLNSTGGPANSTLVMSQKLFTTAFSKGQFGLACAMGVVLAAITLLFSALVFLVNRITGGKQDVSE
ncbi:carbohydrate ABC transporter permease, partial [Arthrobacter silviterrae]